jgi:hypothetical protein
MVKMLTFLCVVTPCELKGRYHFFLNIGMCVHMAPQPRTTTLSVLLVFTVPHTVLLASFSELKSIFIDVCNVGYFENILTFCET